MILLTGGSGLLGTELQKLGKFIVPSHEEFDITDTMCIDRYIARIGIPSLIVHCAAYTDVAKAEKEKELCYKINIIGTKNIMEIGAPVIYISTEYVFDGKKGNYKETDIPNPVNFYSLTKLLGEVVVREYDAIIVRTTLKRRPFEHSKACIDQYTTGDYVDVIAKEIMKVIRNFDILLREIINIGTDKKSVFELARQTRDVEPVSIKDIEVPLPRDTSLDLTKWRRLCDEYRLC